MYVAMNGHLHLWPTARGVGKEHNKKNCQERFVGRLFWDFFSPSSDVFYPFKEKKKKNTLKPEICIFVDKILHDQGADFWESAFQIVLQGTEETGTIWLQ